MATRIAIAAIVLALSLIISGCAGSGRAYEGAPRPREAIAVIKGSGSITGELVFIDGVDGKVFSPSLSKVEVLPGRRTMTVRYLDVEHCIPLIGCRGLGPTTFTYSEVVEINAEAGHTYQFRGEGTWADRPDPINLRLFDTETNEVIWQIEIDSNNPTSIGIVR